MKEYNNDFLSLITILNNNYFPTVLKYNILGNNVFLLDLSRLKINLSSRTPIIDIINNSKHEDAENTIKLIEEILIEGGYVDRIPIIFVEKYSSEFSSIAAEKWIHAIFIDLDWLREVERSTNPTNDLLELASKQVPLSILSPYETTRPVTASKFFGRDFELRNITTHPDTNYAILGSRRIGKTSLLMEFKRLASPEYKKRIIYIKPSA